MKNFLIKSIKSIPVIGRWKEYSEKYFALYAEPGKYNSPIVTWDEVKDNGYYSMSDNAELKDIELNTEKQFELLEQLSPYLKDFPFPAKQSPEFRYFYKNPMFAYNDGAVLYSFLNVFHPEKIIEVGSGYSSALMLDTFEKLQNKSVELTFIDPYTTRVDQLLSKSDLLVSKFIQIPVQKVDTEEYKKLKKNEIGRAHV